MILLLDNRKQLQVIGDAEVMAMVVIYNRQLDFHAKLLFFFFFFIFHVLLNNFRHLNRLEVTESGFEFCTWCL